MNSRSNTYVVRGDKNTHELFRHEGIRGDFTKMRVFTCCAPEKERLVPAHDVKMVSSRAIVSCPLCIEFASRKG